MKRGFNERSENHLSMEKNPDRINFSRDCFSSREILKTQI